MSTSIGRLICRQYLENLCKKPEKTIEQSISTGSLGLSENTNGSTSPLTVTRGETLSVARACQSIRRSIGTPMQCYCDSIFTLNGGASPEVVRCHLEPSNFLSRPSRPVYWMFLSLS